MGLIQIALIWGAASSALFSSPVQSGEWENFKDLKEALVRSSAKRDVLLPNWVSTLDYKRSYSFYDVSALKKSEKPDEKILVAPPVSVPVVANDSGNGINPGNGKHD